MYASLKEGNLFFRHSESKILKHDKIIFNLHHEPVYQFMIFF